MCGQTADVRWCGRQPDCITSATGAANAHRYGILTAGLSEQQKWMWFRMQTASAARQQCSVVVEFLYCCWSQKNAASTATRIVLHEMTYSTVYQKTMTEGGERRAKRLVTDRQTILIYGCSPDRDPTVDQVWCIFLAMTNIHWKIYGCIDNGIWCVRLKLVFCSNPRHCSNT